MATSTGPRSTAWVARLGLVVLVWLVLGLVTGAPLFFGRRGWWDPVLQPLVLWVHIYASLLSVPFLVAKVWATWRLLTNAPPGRQAPVLDRGASAATLVFAIFLYGSGGLLAWNLAPEGNAWLKDVHLYSTLAMAVPLTWHMVRRLGQSWRMVQKLAVGTRAGSWGARLYTRRDVLALSLLAAFSWILGRTSDSDASADPNDFPVTNFGPAPASIDLSSWRLRVVGTVGNPLDLSYEDLMRFPRERHRYSLDCVTGWSATRDWEGIPIRQLLQLAQPEPAEPRVRFITSTGNDVIMWPAQWGRPGALLATHVSGVPFTPDHGFPLRLMIPGTTGEENLKWLVEIQVLGG